MHVRPCQFHNTVCVCLQISAIAPIGHPEQPVNPSDQEHVEHKNFNGKIEDVEAWLVLDRVRVRNRSCRQEVACISEAGTSRQQ